MRDHAGSIMQAVIVVDGSNPRFLPRDAFDGVLMPPEIAPRSPPRTVVIYELLYIGLLFAVARVRLRRTLT